MAPESEVGAGSGGGVSYSAAAQESGLFLFVCGFSFSKYYSDYDYGHFD